MERVRAEKKLLMRFNVSIAFKLAFVISGRKLVYINIVFAAAIKSLTKSLKQSLRRKFINIKEIFVRKMFTLIR